jgi:ribosomal protein S18 acetylase RimI-like enzyme
VHKPGTDEPTAWKENLPNALRNIAYNPEGMLQQAWPALLEEYPAHLHIDILEGYRRGGFGRKLIDHFCDHIAKQGAIGVHLGMAAANVEAGNFYDRIGIGRYPHVLDGVSGELGRTKENTIIRVKTLR